jgi:hypothetical protein
METLKSVKDTIFNIVNMDTVKAIGNQYNSLRSNGITNYVNKVVKEGKTVVLLYAIAYM